MIKIKQLDNIALMVEILDNGYILHRHMGTDDIQTDVPSMYYDKEAFLSRDSIIREIDSILDSANADIL